MATWLENMVYKMHPRGGDNWQKNVPQGLGLCKIGQKVRTLPPLPPPVQGIQLTDAFT